MDANSLNMIKRGLAFIFGILTWIVSVKFSNDGFNFEIHQDMTWAGVTLAIAISVVELAFNSQLQYKGRNWTLFALGIFSYMYGVMSNLIGIHYGQGFSDLATLFDNPVSGGFKLALALFTEFAPEVLIVFGLIGIGNDGDGDFVSNLFGGLSGVSMSKRTSRTTSNKTSAQIAKESDQRQGKSQQPMSKEEYYAHGGQGPNRGNNHKRS